MKNEYNEIDVVQQYKLTLYEATEVFVSCGCSTNVTVPSPSQAILTINGPVSFCPTSIFEEHVEKAKELMKKSHPDIGFHVEIVDVEGVA